MSLGENKGSSLATVLLLCVVVIAAGLYLLRDNGGDAPPLRFGAILPLSGAAAAAGRAPEAGLLLAKEEIAAHPDSYAPVRIFVGDSAFDPGQGQAVAEKLIDEDIDVLFSSFSYITNEVSPIAAAKGIPLFYDSCNCGFAEENSSAFQLYFDPRKECRNVAEYFKREGAMKGAFLGQDVPYGKYCFEAMQDVLGAANVIIEQEAKDVMFDYYALLENLKNQDVGFVLSVPSVNDFTSLFIANADANINLPIACFEGACMREAIVHDVSSKGLSNVIGFGFALSDGFIAEAHAAGLMTQEELVNAAVAHDAVLYAAVAGKTCERSDHECMVKKLTTSILPAPAILSKGFGDDRILDYTSAYVHSIDGTRVPFNLD
jgi:ABC-type branched-subunit amino acid transport system substrate-binding protein